MVGHRIKILIGGTENRRWLVDPCDERCAEWWIRTRSTGPVKQPTKCWPQSNQRMRRWVLADNRGEVLVFVNLILFDGTFLAALQLTVLPSTNQSGHNPNPRTNNVNDCLDLASYSLDLPRKLQNIPRVLPLARVLLNMSTSRSFHPCDILIPIYR